MKRKLSEASDVSDQKQVESTQDEKASSASASAQESSSTVNKAKRTRRGRRSNATSSKLKTNELIAQLHTLRKQAAVSKDPNLQKELQVKEAALGGLKAYQDASVSASQTGGETSKWLVKTLISLLPTNRHQLKKQILIDVGAISGTAYSKWPMMKCTSIDLNPRSEDVLKWDWLELTPQDVDAVENSFDIICLSLVLNFQGELEKRAEMILHAHHFLKPEGKLYIVLPLACLNNSRYLTHKHFKTMLKSFGFSTVLKQHDSTKLSYWLVQRDGPDAGWDGTPFKKAEVRPGIKRNNFAITKKSE